MGLTLTGSNFSLKTERPSFSKGTGLNSSKKQKKSWQMGEKKARTLHTSIYPLPFLAPGKEKGRPTAIASSHCSSRHIKEGRFPSGGDMATFLRHGNVAKFISLALIRESSN